jgi:peroxiredoxin (alkyl hydroperoxide reductase subunit C)
MIALNQALPEFTERSCDVLGVSTDGVFAHIAWMEFHIGQLEYPLASDRSQVVSTAYGVLDDDGRAARAVFVIDPEGVVRFETIYDDRVGRSIDELLRVLDALQRPGRTFAQYTSPPRQREADCGRAALPG